MKEINQLQIKAINSLCVYISYCYPDLDLKELENSINAPQILIVDSLPNNEICKYYTPEESEQIVLNDDKLIKDNGCILVSFQNVFFNEILSLISLVKEYMKANTTFIVDDFNYLFDKENFKLASTFNLLKTNDRNYFCDILKGSPDLCRNSVDNYNRIKSFIIQNETNQALYSQNNIYDTLLFLASYCSVQLLNNPNLNIKYILKDYVKADTNPKSKANCLANLILKTNKLEIFKSIIDPITYTLGDMHYDYLLNSLNINEKKLLYNFFK